MSPDIAYAGAILIIAGAVVLAYWAVFTDHSRGRQRCPKCWYDMSGDESNRCPECGKQILTKQTLLRTRRRWRWVAASLFLVLIGISLSLYPKVHQDGWLSLVPSSILIGLLDDLDEPTSLLTELETRLSQRALNEEQRIDIIDFMIDYQLDTPSRDRPQAYRDAIYFMGHNNALQSQFESQLLQRVIVLDDAADIKKHLDIVYWNYHWNPKRNDELYNILKQALLLPESNIGYIAYYISRVGVGNPDAATTLIELFPTNDDYADIRLFESICSLGRTDDTAADFAWSVLISSAPRERAIALSKGSLNGAIEREKVFRVLWRATRDASPLIRAAAYKGFGKHQFSNKPFGDQLLLGINDTDPAVRLEVATALSRSIFPNQKTAAFTTLEELATSNDEDISGRAAGAMVRATDIDQLDEILTRLDQDQPHIRAQIVNALSYRHAVTSSPELLNKILTYANDPDERVRCSVASALKLSQQLPQKAINILQNLKIDSSRLVREVATRGYYQLGERSDSP